MKRKLEDYIGEHVGQVGDEDRYFCMLCGTKGLLVHKERGVYYCFTCGEGGKFSNGEVDLQLRKIEAPTTFSTFREILNEYGMQILPSSERKEIRGISVETLQDIDAATIPGGIAIGLYLDRKPVGLQAYSNCYITKGIRGIDYVYSNQDLELDHTFIFEGMFDWLSTYQIFKKINGSETIQCCFIYTVGNMPSIQQLQSIVDLAKSSQIHICYDNDKIHPPLRLMHRLKLLTDNEVKLLLPPNIEGVKDWDDFVNKQPETAKAYFEDEGLQ